MERPDAYSASAFRNDFSMRVGDTEQLLCVYYPENAKPAASISASSSDPEIAEIDNSGTITAVGNGSTSVSLTLNMPNGSIYYVSANVTVGDETVIGGDGVSSPYVNAAGIAKIGTNSFEVSFADGYPKNMLNSGIYASINLADNKNTSGISLSGLSYKINDNRITFEEKDFRAVMNRRYPEIKVIPAGEYEVKLTLDNYETETYYLGKMVIERDILNRAPEDLTVSATDEGHSITISCGDNEACDVYLGALYDERYISGQDNGSEWTKIGLNYNYDQNGIVIADNGTNEEYLIPDYSASGRMVSLKIPADVLEKYGISEDDYAVRILSPGTGYYDAGEETIHFIPTDEAVSLIPQDMKWSTDAIFSFKLPYGTWYSVTLKNQRTDEVILQDVSLVSDELGNVSYDFSYLTVRNLPYCVLIKTAKTENDVKYAVNGFISDTYNVAAYRNLDYPINLQFDDDGSISWDAVLNAEKYYVTLSYGMHEETVITSETSLLPDWESMEGHGETSIRSFGIKAVGDQKNWANSETVYCDENCISSVASDALEVTVNLDGKESEGITNVLYNRAGRQTFTANAVSPDNKTLKEIRFSEAGTFTYNIYLANDNPSVVPNYDTYTVTYDVTLDDNDNVLKVSKPEIKDNDGKTVTKIVFDLITPKPAEYAPTVVVNLNGAAANETGMFTVRLKDDEGEVIQTKQNDANGLVSFDNIEGLDDAEKYYYHVEAEVEEGYVLESAVRHIEIDNNGYEEDGTFKPTVRYYAENNTEVNELTFNYVTEEYTVKTGTIKLELVQDGSDPVSVFNYVMKNMSSGDENDFEYILAKGKETEKEITFTSPGSYRYEFTVLDNNPGLKYDYAKYYAEYEVEEKNGSLAIISSRLTDESGNEVSSFAYEVTSKGPVSFTPSVKVRLDGETPADGLFTFVLKDDEGIIQDDVKVNAGENIPFADLTFNQMNFTDIGNYYFTVNQQGTDGQYILDKTIYHIAVEVGAGDNDLVVKDYYYDYTENEQDYTQVEEPVYENTTPESIPLESISLDRTELTLQKGETDKLEVIFNPDNTTDDKTVSWTSSDEAVVSINSEGIIAGVGIGNAVIRATVGNKTAECIVTVNAKLVSIELNKTETTLKKGDTEKLTVTYNPEDTTDDKTVIWTTSDEAVVTVSEDGTVTAVKAGTATITAKVGEHTATAKVTVIIPLESIELNKTETTLKKGDTEKLTVTYNPEDTTDDKTVIWTTSDEAVVTVSEDGTVTAVKAGTATITAKVGEHTATAKVTVIIPLESIELNKTETTLKKGDTEKLTVTYNPEDTTDDKTVIWTTSDEAVVTVSEDGTVTAVKAGTATITAKVGEHTATAKVTVIIPVESIRLDKNEMTIKKGASGELTAEIIPEDATNQKVHWSSSDEKIVTVDGHGTVRAVNTGTADITVTADDGGYTAKCEITVIIPLESITLSSSELTLKERKTEKLTVTYNPEDTTDDKTVIWTTSDEAVVTVSEDGTVTAVKAGTATITAKVGEHTATAKVTVLKHEYKVTEWNWAENYGSASVELECLDCDDKPVVPAEITVNRVNPTTETEGKIEYTAKAVYDETEYTDIKTVILEKISITEPETEIISTSTEAGQEIVNAMSETTNAYGISEEIKEAAETVTIPDTVEVEESQKAVIETFMKIDIDGYDAGTEENASITLNITPMYQIMIVEEGESGEEIKTPVGEQKELSITKPVTLIIPVGNAFEGLEVKSVVVTHKKSDGRIYQYDGEYDAETKTVKFVNPDGFSEFEINVFSEDVKAVSEVSITEQTVSLKKGETIKLGKEIKPENAIKMPVTWESSDPSVATVEEGTVTAVNAGTATITVTVGGKSASCEVTVVEKEKVEMYRMYNPYTQEHLYTGLEGERDNLVSHGWIYEGFGFYAPKESSTPMYRLYNPNNSDHHYTASEEEIEFCVRNGWIREGICWYADDDKEVAQYRLFNPYIEVGSHHYTYSEEERDFLTSIGWIYEGIGFYTCK